MTNTDPTREMLRIRGGVMLRTSGHQGDVSAEALAKLPPELVAALGERTPDPLRRFWTMLRQDAAFRPRLTAAAIGVQALTLMVQAAIFRGLIDIAEHRPSPGLIQIPAQPYVGCVPARTQIDATLSTIPAFQ